MWMLMLLLGCPKTVSTQDDALRQTLSRIDRDWARRDGRLREHVQYTQEQQTRFRQAPGITWRLARANIALGLTFPEANRRADRFRVARDLSWSCIVAEPRVEALLAESGIEDALSELPDERVGCASYGALAWARWRMEFGPDAAALDAKRIDELVVRASTHEDHEWVGNWARALMSESEGRRLGLLALSEGFDRTEGIAGVDLVRWESRSPETENPLPEEGRAYLAWVMAER